MPAVLGSWFASQIVTLTNLTNGKTLKCNFMPAELEESLEVNYQRLTVPGLSHQPQQYSNTGNLTYGMELYFRSESEEDTDALYIPRKFLMAACYPRGGDSVLTHAPAQVMFVWPFLVTITAIITSLQFRHSRFTPRGHSIQYTARVGLEEIRDVRLLADEVYERDTRRGSDQLWHMVRGASGVSPEGRAWGGDRWQMEDEAILPEED